MTTRERYTQLYSTIRKWHTHDWYSDDIMSETAEALGYADIWLAASRSYYNRNIQPNARDTKRRYLEKKYGTLAYAA